MWIVRAELTAAVANAIGIDGFEAAGHTGEDDVTSLILVPLTRDAIDLPLIASGGFADGRGLAGALSLWANRIGRPNNPCVCLDKI